MHIEVQQNNGKPYLRLVKAVRKKNKNGAAVSTKEVVLNIGPLDRFDDGQPDYVARLRQSFRDGDPLLPELRPYCEETRHVKYSLAVEEGSPDCIARTKLASPLLLERILEELGLLSLFASYKKTAKVPYDVYGFAKLMVFDRVLRPASLSGLTRRNGDYYTPPLKEGYDPGNVYDTLDFICENRDRIIRRLHTSLVKKAHRSAKAVCYSVTRYRQAEDGDAPDGRRPPAARVGIFLDDAGLPISLEEFPGDMSYFPLVRSTLRKNVDETENSRFIFVGDGTRGRMDPLPAIKAGNGYIVSGDLRGIPGEERAWALLDEGYTPAGSDFQMKSRVAERMFTDDDGTCHIDHEKVVVFRSRRIRDRAMAENRNLLGFLKRLEEEPGNFNVTYTQAISVREFLRDGCRIGAVQWIRDSAALKPLVDFDRVRDFEESMGYFRLLSSETDMEPLEILDRYCAMKQTEDIFRVMKGAAENCPSLLRKPEHFTAHLAVCLIALLVTRIIQKRVAGHEKAGTRGAGNADWPFTMPAGWIPEALNRWKVESMPDGLYRFTDTEDPDLKRILDAFGIDIPRKLYTRAELKQIKTGTDIFPRA